MSPQVRFDLGGFLAVERTRVEAALERSMAGLRERADDTPLVEVVEAGVRSGGKRLRPILVVAGHSAVGGATYSAPGPSEALYDLAVSIELVHAYSLIHDDLPCMDDAPLRRGHPTPHTVFGVVPATRAGALLIPWAAHQCWQATCRLGLEERERREILGALLTAAGSEGMVGGQVVDLESEGVSLDEAKLRALHGMKTGALLAASLDIGALAGGAEPAQRAALAKYGRDLGLAFQIADDVLDRTSTAERLGKAPSDQGFDKSTFVALLGVDGARTRGREVVAGALAALAAAKLTSPALEGLAAYVLERER